MILYKRTSTGKIQCWQAEVNGNQYRTTSGQYDGKKVTSKWTTVLAKNIGKANYMSPEDQAFAEVEAMYVKKLKSKYYTDINDVDVKQYFEPMSAKKWHDYKEKLDGEMVWVQPKYDGMRCIVSKYGLTSRNGEEIVSIPHINSVFEEFFLKYPDYIIDGELYNHDLKDDFNKIMSLCKKRKNITPEEYAESAEKIKLYSYDCYLNNDCSYMDRLDFLKSLPAMQNVIISETLLIKSHSCELVNQAAHGFIKAGYEGAMIRRVGGYVNKRSNTLLKWKQMQDDEFEIVDILSGAGNKAGIAASIKLLTNGTKEVFHAGVIGNEAYCLQLLQDKEQYIGKLGTVIFQDYTPAGIPRFAKLKAVRDYE